MNRTDEDCAKIPIPPLLIFLGLLVAGVLLSIYSPLTSVTGGWVWRIGVGVPLSLFSGFLAISAMVSLSRHKTAFDPAQATTALVCKGIFCISRNPMYLSLVLLLLAVSALMASLWLVVLAALLVLALHHLAIKPEEAYLLGKFGEVYRDYMKQVRRWI